MLIATSDIRAARRSPSSHMLVWDASTPEGRAGAAQFFKGLGTGDVLIPYSAAEKRAAMIRQLGEATVRTIEARAPFRDGKRAINERFARATAEAVRVIATAAVPARIGRAA